MQDIQETVCSEDPSELAVRETPVGFPSVFPALSITVTVFVKEIRLPFFAYTV
jgi:hypothetical protein